MHPIGEINTSVKNVEMEFRDCFIYILLIFYICNFLSSLVYNLGKLSQVKFMVWYEYDKYNDLCASSENYFTS